MDVTTNSNKFYDTNTLSWAQQLQDYLYNKILPLAESDSTKRIKLVESEPMKIWVIAFTHSSFNPNTDSNYEVLEYLGDQSMAACLAKYLIKRFKGINQSQLSTFKSHFLDKVRLSQISLELGLSAWVRRREDDNINIQEDLMESLFGALTKIADEYIQEGLGSIYCYNMIVNLFNRVKADFSLFLGMPKTQVKEIFEKLGWIEKGAKPPQTSEKVDQENFKVTVFLTPEAIAWFKARSTSLTSLPQGKILGRSISGKKAATINAYDQALKTLKSLGVDWTIANQIKNHIDFQRPEMAPYLASLNEKTKSLGITGIYFPKNDIVKEKGREVKYVQLIGILSNNRKIILSIIKGSKTDDDLKLRVKAITSFLARKFT